MTVAGNLQTALGCSGDWQPDCVASQLSLDANDNVWKGTFVLPSGSYQYKAALNGSWDENYGLDAQQNGANIPLTSDGSTPITFLYDHKTHWITDTTQGAIVTAPGSFQSELGCSQDWDPGCLRSWLEDPDGDGTYSFSTTSIPAGNYETKVAINRSWDVNYGAGGVAGGANIPFTVPSDNALVTFSFDSVSHVLTISSANDTVSTAVRDAANNAITGPVASGTVVHDEAAVAKATDTADSVPNPTGTVDFTLYDNGTCNGNVLATDPNKALSGTGTATSASFTTPAAGGTFSYLAHYDGDSNYPQRNAACESFSVQALPTADLALAIAASPKPVPAGKLATFTIIVQNNGPYSSQATLTNQLPAASQFVGYTTSKGSCTVPKAGTTGTMTCTVGSLAGGQSAVVTATVKPTAKKGASISDTASVTGSTLDPVSSNNTATVTISVK